MIRNTGNVDVREGRRPRERAPPRCFVCLATTNSSDQPLIECCRCCVAHERCLIDELSTHPDDWECPICNDLYTAQLSGSSFWFSIFAQEIQSRCKLRCVNGIFAFECFFGFVVQILLSAYISKAILWVVTHQDSYPIGDGSVITFTLPPNINDLLLGLIAYFVWVPLWLLIIFIGKMIITGRQKIKHATDFTFPHDNS